MKKTAQIKRMFTNILETPSFDEELVQEYFTEDYIQNVDGSTLNRNEFEQHVKKLKSKTKTLHIEILNAAENEHTVFTKHLVNTVLKTGETVQLKVFAEFTFFGNKIKHCDELTILLKGNSNEKDLGSEV